MPNRRPVRKGSFAAHLDELIKHFNHEPPPQKPASRKRPSSKRKPKVRCVHQALFERAAH